MCVFVCVCVCVCVDVCGCVCACFRFDIRVMQSGRLRGQAFIGLPSEQVACQAREDVNGYELQGKPLVVVICATDV